MNEHGGIEEWVYYPPGVPDRLDPNYADTTFPTLRFVDPVGDTVFNHLQIPAVLEEWSRLRSRAITEEETAFLTEVERLAQRCLPEVGQYLKFIGD